MASFSFSTQPFTFVPIAAPTVAPVMVRAYKPGYFAANLRFEGDLITITSPLQFSPYWMTMVGTPPADWLPYLENVAEPKVEREIIKVPTSAQAQEWVDTRDFP